MKIKNVLMVSAEVEPYLKTGGLGDVTGALPKALNQLGMDTRVIMPLYSRINDEYRKEMKFLGYFYVDLGWRHQYCGLFELNLNGFITYFLDNEYYFKKDEIYDYQDVEKFAFLDLACLEACKYLNFKPDIIHLHDWHTGPVAALINDCYCYQDFYKDTKVVFTIHNLAYQGIFSKDVVLDLLPLNKDKYANTDTINYLALGIQYSYRVTTVSPTYAGEILTNEYGEGLQYLLRAEVNKLSGILNGIDSDHYNSATDKLIYKNFDNTNFESGKLLNKKALLKDLGFDVKSSIDKPLIAIISRLADQKGMDLVLTILNDLLAKDVRIVVLGSGNKELEKSFNYFNILNKEKFRAILKFDNSLAHKIYAASDLFLMPSKFEPCGLAQMICLRYGTIPLCRLVGGLKDSIVPYNEYNYEGNGFGFYSYDSKDFYNTIIYALSLYDKKEHWNKIIENGFKCNFTWENSASKYVELFKSI